MHDGGKISAGLGAFLALVLLPVWQSALRPPAKRPEPKLVGAERRCVAPRAEMRTSHMVLLNAWRDGAVRRAERTVRTADGRDVDVSFAGSCLSCHPNKRDFCDACHDDLAVKPVCWDCHLEPKVKA